jgi:HK97 family phage portal protein
VTIENDEDGEMFYRVRNNHGKPTDLERHEVFHVPSWMSDDGIVGKGVVRHAREAIGHALATDRYGASFFSGGGRPQAVLKHKEKLDKEARKNLREEWNAIYGNQSTQNKTAVLGEGIEYESIATSPEDNQFLQSRQFNIEEICRWYGVPPHLVDHLLRATFNNIEHLGIDFVKYKLIRWLKIWEVEVWRKLLTKDERQRMYAKHNVDALERGDLTSRTAAMAQQFFNGKRTLNEWRETEDESSIGPLGDIHFVQSAMIPLSLAAEGKGGSVQPQPPANEPVKPPLPPEEEEETEEEEPDDGAKLTASGQRVVYQATLGVLEEIVGIMLDKESSAAIQASKKPGQFLAWLDSFYEDHAARMTKALARPIRACVLASGEPLIVAEVLDDAVQRHIQASKAAILEASSGPPEEFTESIAKCVTNWNRNEILNLLSGGYHV